MTNTMASAGKPALSAAEAQAAKERIAAAIARLSGWLESNDYKGYDTFDGLNARFVRPLTFGNKFLQTVLQQGVRRFPWNLRPLLGVPKGHSTKGMGFMARGFLRMEQSTGEATFRRKAEEMLSWLMEHQSPGYSGACWGNHFDYQSRSFYLPKNVPTVVWTSLIGHAFLDAYEAYGDKRYLDTVLSSCTHIMKDLDLIADKDGICIGYIPADDSGTNKMVHNSNTLGGSLLARAYKHSGNEAYRALAEKSIRYTANYQQADGAWWYGEKENLRWVDNFHTAYVLDCFKHYSMATGDEQFDSVMEKGYRYWKETFFLSDGTPRYYNHKTLPLDIQCSSQAIDTLAFFSDRDPGNLRLAVQVADWTIENMQDHSGYFYYRRYSSWLVNKTPTLHWGQATMLCALAGLHKRLQTN